MAYLTVHTMQVNVSLMNRCTSAVATEVTAGHATGDNLYASAWVANRSWDIASTPGWSAQWEYGEAQGIKDPGASAVVITDGDILARTQQLLALYPLSDLSPPGP